MPKVRLDNHSSPAVATHKPNRPDKKFELLLRLVERVARSTERTAIRQKEWLSLTEVAWLLGTSDTTLRNNGLLNDLHERAYDPQKLNGYRVSKSPNAQWRFHQDEFRRFGPTLHRRNVDDVGEVASDKAAQRNPEKTEVVPES